VNIIMGEVKPMRAGWPIQYHAHEASLAGAGAGPCVVGTATGRRHPLEVLFVFMKQERRTNGYY